MTFSYETDNFLLRSNFNTREFNSREHLRFLGHNSEPCGNFGTMLRHKLPVIHPDLPIPTRDLNSSVKLEFCAPDTSILKNVFPLYLLLIPLKGPIKT